MWNYRPSHLGRDSIGSSPSPQMTASVNRSVKNTQDQGNMANLDISHVTVKNPNTHIVKPSPVTKHEKAISRMN